MSAKLDYEFLIARLVLLFIKSSSLMSQRLEEQGMQDYATVDNWVNCVWTLDKQTQL